MIRDGTKIALLSTLHPRDDIRIFVKQACSLAEINDYEVHFLVYDGLKNEVNKNVRIINVGGSQKESNRFFRLVLGSFFAIKYIIINKFDIVHFHDPELIFVGILLRLIGIKVIYDVHENVRMQILTKKWIKSGLRALVSKLFAFIEHNTAYFWNYVVCATPSIAKNFSHISNIIVINNYPIVQPNYQRKNIKNIEIDVIYIGVISLERGITFLLDAILFDPKIRVCIVGRFDSNDTKAICESHVIWKYVNYVSWSNKSKVDDLLSKSLSGIVNFLPLENHIESQPNKLFEYMEAGLAVIASDFPLWRTLIEESSSGFLVDPTKSDSIYAAISNVTSNVEQSISMGSNGRKVIVKEFNWEFEKFKLYDIYKKIRKLT